LVNDAADNEGDAPLKLRRLLAEVPNMSELSRVTGINRRSLDRYRDGMEPSLSVAAKIARALNKPLDALAYGGLTLEVGQSDQDLIRVPFLNLRASAGPGSSPDEIEVLGSIPYSRQLLRRYGVNPESVQALTSRGDSMSPTIEDGQVILVDRSVRQVRQDAIYVVSIDHDIRVKRIQKSIGGALTLKSDNPAYAQELLSAADAAKLKIEGRVFLGERLL
jgi:transcriptional regulator with XRE-family HTH domain